MNKKFFLMSLLLLFFCFLQMTTIISRAVASPPTLREDMAYLIENVSEDAWLQIVKCQISKCDGDQKQCMSASIQGAIDSTNAIYEEFRCASGKPYREDQYG